MKHDLCKFGALPEGGVPDTGDAFGNRDALQASAAAECPSTNAGDAITNRDTRQPEAVLEGRLPDAGDAVGNRDTRQGPALLEGPPPDAGNRIASNGVRNDQIAGGKLIRMADGDFPVTRPVSQVIQTGSMERQEGTGKERKKDLKRFHDALALPHVRRQVKLETGVNMRGFNHNM